MKIKQDLLHITNTPTLDDGTPAEPEQQTASRVLLTDADAATTTGKAVGAMNAQVIIESSAGEMARALRGMCSNCKHYDNAAFQRFLSQADHPASPMHVREGVNELRAALLQTYNAQLQTMHAGADGDMDVEHALKQLGFCRALGEIHKDDIIVHPLSSCPPETITDSTPSGLYQSKDRASERAGDKAYDNILKRAAGKVD